MYIWLLNHAYVPGTIAILHAIQNCLAWFAMIEKLLEIADLAKIVQLTPSICTCPYICTCPLPRSLRTTVGHLLYKKQIICKYARD